MPGCHSSNKIKHQSLTVHNYEIKQKKEIFMMPKKTLYFLCTGNSCRSQMAEGWGKKYLGDEWKVLSAGIEAHGVNPNRSEEHTSELQSRGHLVCRLLLER